MEVRGPILLKVKWGSGAGGKSTTELYRMVAQLSGPWRIKEIVLPHKSYRG